MDLFRNNRGYKELPSKSAYLSIIIPLYNEAESVEKLVEQIEEVGRGFSFSYELILVDDGSSDATWQIIENIVHKIPRIRGIKLRRNFGQTSAMVAGFENAVGEIIVTMDGDMQNDPRDIKMLLAKIEDGYDIVSGWRKNRKDHISRILPSRVANYIISATTGIRLHDYGCSLKAYRAESIRSIKAYGEMHRFFPALASMTGAKVTELPVTHHPRQFGKSKYGFNRIFKVFSDIFALNLIVRFSAFPLKGFALLSIPFVALSLFFFILGMASVIFHWTAGKSNFFFISAAINGIAVLHLFGLGLIAELVVGSSDLSHTLMAEKSKKVLKIKNVEFSE